MKFKMTFHFRTRLAQRNIDLNSVEKVIKYPDKIEGVFGGRTKVTKKIGVEVVTVVYYAKLIGDKQMEYLLITVY